ncbi:iron-sulfur cluster biosynthesis family protein [Companilactobacillus zhachilii]|uniref:iron-sulfur cluster biosynthesis family protein n=1 Tax=Companilactobacillus zhachilii TaxID=2304606 RepID=UPI004034BF5C
MKIEVSKEAQAKLERYVSADKKLLLDLDDGFGRFSDEGTCAFRLVYSLFCWINSWLAQV